MERPESVLHAVKRSIGGVDLPHSKNTAECVSVFMPPPHEVVIPMQQHIGAPCVPCVKKGDTVFVGTKIGDSDKLISAPIHASVSGTVTDIKKVLMPSGQSVDAIVIESDGTMTEDPSIAPVAVETPEQLVKAARESGLVGLGGAGFPAHVKLTKRPGQELDTLIVNGAECEPFITADYRECMENTENILEGVYMLKRIMGFKRVIICVEDNKPKAIEALYSIAADLRDADDTVKLMKLRSHYPQGAEKILIYSATGRVLPLGKLPSDVGCVVMNIASVSFLNKYITTGMPLVRKLITVDGGAVAEPQNVIVPVGTSVRDVLEFCGGLKSSARKILLGGPMMGTAIYDPNMPILKQNNAILAFDRKQAERMTEQPCIRCGRCAAACPMRLRPLDIEPAYRTGNKERVAELHADYCIECGCCSYSCPSKRYLTQIMRLAKASLKEKK